MSETSDLLRLFRVENQLNGLKSRLGGAERFLKAQQQQLDALDTQLKDADDKLQRIKVMTSDEEGEAARLDGRMAEIREKMTQTKTAKEYTALLTELNTYKEAKSEVEDKVLSELGQLDELQTTRDELQTQRVERAKIVENAEKQRAEREAEIGERLEELTAKRDEIASSIPAAAKSILQAQIQTNGDDAMSPVEIIDRRNKEYSCGACMMAIPIETVNAVISGKLTQCVSCHCILFTEEDLLSKKKKATADT